MGFRLLGQDRGSAVFEAIHVEALSELVLLMGVFLTGFGEKKSDACLGCQSIPAVYF